MIRRDFWGRCRSRGRLGTALVLGGLWWWAALRAFGQPGRGGPVEVLVVAGGWGLSLLPVHCVPWTRRRPRRVSRVVRSAAETLMARRRSEPPVS
ncbi:hypothetical protein [Streptomyces albireticuli]|uniref:Uncharacterized protein n=1 Tax=Streptomyces albireticuli TaxID=1940 RepID=A0A2A2DFN8_9ACTN|nr:hypothetical protein [Streptomyces albireticuli]MCD9145614.1 hypothetical protein [Streptomyces albireticuli]MCD9165096.1 hypothetical protein [Streptomyces albireticuli]MCD9195625.1 hypothetical protein [Streptomyces albireticuli]PAU50257.1 hypothetical protein CK936_03600 [Streptomyces albireticuli]